MTSTQKSLESAAAVALTDLPLTSFLPQRYRPGNIGTWSGHLAFANDLVSAIAPSLIVELGTHWGESYFAFCQSIFENGLDCRSYAVDNWLGETHSGSYGEDVFHDVKHYNQTHYGQFSTLLRMQFDDALSRFSNESIDLLHIDGFHTYEAVSHDFRTWLPKVKPGGIILMHDIEVRDRDFGVWRLWEEIRHEFAETFEFFHSWGLGVIRKRGGEPRTYPAPLNIMFHGSAEVQERLRRHYHLYASYLETTLRNSSETAIQIYPFGENGYSEETSLLQPISIERTQKISFTLPHGLGHGPVRIDPAACPCVVDITRIAVVENVSNVVLWEAAGAPQLLSSLKIAGSAALLANSRSGLLVSYGDDPQVVLPDIQHHSGAVRIEITLRLTSSYAAVYECLQAQAGDVVDAASLVATEQIRKIDSDLTSARTVIEDLSAELRGAQSERLLMAFEMKKAIFDRRAAERELKRVELEAAVNADQNGALLRAEIESLRRVQTAQIERRTEVESLCRNQNAELELQRVEIETLRRDQTAELERQRAEAAISRAVDLEADISSLQAALREEQLIRSGIVRSISWRATEPGRKVMLTVRSVLHKR